jgi:hypothetical protein
MCRPGWLMNISEGREMSAIGFITLPTSSHKTSVCLDDSLQNRPGVANTNELLARGDQSEQESFWLPRP